MSKHTSVRLDEHFQTFIAAQLREGRYRSANEVVRAGLALLEHQVKLEALRAALIEGEQSGFIEDFTSTPSLRKSFSAKVRTPSLPHKNRSC